MMLRVQSYTCSLEPWGEPCDIFSHFSHQKYTALLTGKEPEERASHSIIGIDPHTIITHNGVEMSIRFGESMERKTCSLWECIDEVRAVFSALAEAADSVYCGAIGFVSYDALTTIESTALNATPSYSLPLLGMVVYNRYLIFDHSQQRCHSITMTYSYESHINEKSDFLSQKPVVGGFHAECGRTVYCDKVDRVKEYIRNGDVYEVSLSQRFAAQFDGDPYQFFRLLFDKNPAPYSAFILWDGTAIVCNSPELFVRMEGNSIETHPIKGTIQRGRTTEDDERLSAQLLSSEKDQAELYMIVDLLRNDLGKVCDIGSVMVNYPKRCETYETVHHLVASVSGTLHVSYGEALKAVFPGGSITGCPKIRSTEIIDELETYRRHLYTGSIMLINHMRCSANITIRTGIIQNGMLFLNSGGAVTIDSDPDAEYDEIIHKVKNFFAAAGSDDLA